jgi:hypothetical protein
MTKQFHGKPRRFVLTGLILITGGALAAAGPLLAQPSHALEPLAAGEPALAGRLTDLNGTAVGGALVLVLRTSDPNRPPDLDRDDADPGVRTDADGWFVAHLPPGRYTVAALKDGFDVLVTEAYSGSSRFVRLKMHRTTMPFGSRTPPGERGSLWLLRPQQADVLRDRTAEPLPVIFAANPPAGDENAEAPRDARSTTAADIFGSMDGRILQVFGAGFLAGLGSSVGTDPTRDTAVELHAPLGRTLAWNAQARSLRSDSRPEGTTDPLSERSDRLAFGVDRLGPDDLLVRGRVRAGYAEDGIGMGEIDDRVVEGQGDLRLPDGETRLVVAVQAWSTRSDFSGDDMLMLDAPGGADGSNRAKGDGGALYAGTRAAFASGLAVDYGLEYRADTFTRGARVVPRIAVARPLNDDRSLAIEGEILLDGSDPGGRLAVHGRPGTDLMIEAGVSVLPADALQQIGDGASGASGNPPASPQVEPAGSRSCERRTLDLALSRDFGVVSGSLSGSVGRTGRRAVPLVIEGPVPIVSFGDERFYETRLGVSAKRSETHLEIAYRRVAGDVPAGGETAASSDYSRVDLRVAQGLPAPRALYGAKLQALFAWQGLDYDALRGAAGAYVAGTAARLTGGVGLTF